MGEEKRSLDEIVDAIACGKIPRVMVSILQQLAIASDGFTKEAEIPLTHAEAAQLTLLFEEIGVLAPHEGVCLALALTVFRDGSGAAEQVSGWNDPRVSNERSPIFSEVVRHFSEKTGLIVHAPIWSGENYIRLIPVSELEVIRA